MNKEKKEEISKLTIKVLKSRLDSIVWDPTGATGSVSGNLRNMPFHIAFLRAFYNKLNFKDDDEARKYLNLASWFQGLNTTLGQTYFEGVARILINGSKKTFKKCLIGENVANKISDIINKLKAGEEPPNLAKENKELKEAIESSNGVSKKGLKFTADVYFEDKEKVVMIELKSVKPNSGEMRGEKEKILYGKAHFMTTKPNKKVYYYIGFPFDPTVPPSKPCSYNKDNFMNSLIEFKKFFAKDEFLIGSELWDFLSGKKGTMNEILSIIKSIASRDFENKFNTINTFTFVESDKNTEKLFVNEKIFKEYIGILKEWNLYSEIGYAIKIKDKIAEINNNPKNYTLYKKVKSILNKTMFDHKTNGYNLERAKAIKNL